MKKNITILFIAVFIFGCKKKPIKCDPFTSEQLEWLQNLETAKYKVVAQNKTSYTQYMDTINAFGSQKIEEKSRNRTSGMNETLDRDQYVYYYEGTYILTFTNFYNVFVPPGIYINNAGCATSHRDKEKGDYRVHGDVEIYQLVNKEELKYIEPDTALIDGVLYFGVYKMTIPRYSATYKHYFQKGTGFIYVERDSGNYIYSASLIQ